MRFRRPTQALLVTFSTLALAGTAPLAMADQNPDPGGGGPSLPCSARMSMSKTGNTIELIARMRCDKPKYLYHMDIVMRRTGAGPDTGKQWERECKRLAGGTRSCRKVIRFKDIAGKQKYHMTWAGGTHFANPGDKPAGDKNYCKRGSRSGGQIYCVDYSDSRF